MSTPTGQTILVDFKDYVNSIEVNDRLSHVFQRGIYDGGILSKVNDSTVSLTSLVCEIGDSNHQVRATTTTSVNVTVSSSLPYVVLRWAYVGAVNTAMSILAVSAPSANDIVVGLCVFSGATLNGIDYTQRTTPVAFYNYLLVKQIGTSNSVWVSGGQISFGNFTSKVVAQQVDLSSEISSLTSGQSRVDVIVCDSSNPVSSVTILSGAPSSGIPVIPPYGTYIALAEVTLATTGITSVRNVANLPRFTGNAVLLTTDQTVAGVKTFGGGLVIENRTSDPSSPATGRIWIRTDF